MKSFYVILFSVALIIAGCKDESSVEAPTCHAEATVLSLGTDCFDLSLRLPDNIILNCIKEASIAVPFHLEEGTRIRISYQEDSSYSPVCLATFAPFVKWVRISCIRLDEAE